MNLTCPQGTVASRSSGRNGSGKTTLLALLPRFYDPQQGRILIDGVDIRDVTLRSLRRQISIVTQDSVIFPGTIAENIAYGQPLAGRPEMRDGDRRRRTRAPSPTSSSWRSRRATTRSSGDSGGSFPAGKSSDSASPARSCARPRS